MGGWIVGANLLLAELEDSLRARQIETVGELRDLQDYLEGYFNTPRVYPRWYRRLGLEEAP